MAADLKIAPVTCVQKVVLHTDKIVFALEACDVVFAIDPTCRWFHFPTLPQTPIQVSRNKHHTLDPWPSTWNSPISCCRQAREDLPASHFKHYVVWAAPLQDLCDCHEDDDRWSLGRLHVVQSSSVDNAKFKLDPPLSTKEPAGEHWLLVFVAGIQDHLWAARLQRFPGPHA